MPTVGGDRGGSSVGTPDAIFSVPNLAPLIPGGVLALSSMALGETIPRAWVGGLGGGGQSQLTSGTFRAESIILGPGGALMSSITWHMGGTTFTTATAQWFAVYDQARRLLGVTSDDGATAWTANATKTLNLAAPVRLLYGGLYHIAVLWTGTGTPQLTATSDGATSILGVQPIGGNTTDAGLTTPATAPAILGAYAANGQARTWAGAA